jgi:hypothetical protein
VALVKLRQERLLEKIGEKQTGCCGILVHAKASGRGISSIATALYHEEAFAFTRFVNNPG